MRYITVTALCLVLGASWSSGAQANSVLNGGFETGDLTDWTFSPNGVGPDSTFPFTGTYDAFLGTQFDDLGLPTSSPGTLSQVIPTSAGQYILSFALMDEIGSPGDSFTVMFDGVIVDTLTGDQAASYVIRSVTVNSPSNPTLIFQGLNDLAAWNLDDVSLTPVVTSIPEPPSVLLCASALMLSFGMVNLGRRRFRR